MQKAKDDDMEAAGEDVRVLLLTVIKIIEIQNFVPPKLPATHNALLLKVIPEDVIYKINVEFLSLIIHSLCSHLL